MKTLALVMAFLLHTTGLWSHTNDVARTHLGNQALGLSTTAAAPNITTPPYTAPGLPLRQRDQTLELSASHALAVDAATILPLYSKDPGAKVPIASITKIVTVITILDRHTLDEKVTIKPLPTYGPDDDTIGLVAGDTLTVRQLIQAALIQSGNDAADALALWDSGSIPRFTSRMNSMLSKWGITSSHFASASGLQDTGNTSTASDLARMGKLILTNPFVAETVKSTSTDITSAQNHTYHLKTTNTLLENGLLYGIKTGYTPAAGECLLGITQIDGHAVITVILGSNDRFGDTVRLINWIGSSYQWL